MSYAVQELEQPWIRTYDRRAIDHGLYPSYRRIEYGLPYTAQGKHKGKEVMFLSHCLSIPDEWADHAGPVRLTPANGRYSLYGVLDSRTTSSVPT